MKNVEVRLINKNDYEILNEFTRLEKVSFGKGGLNEWTLSVLIRYGKVFALYVGGELAGLTEIIKDWRDSSKAFIIGFSLKKESQGKGLGIHFLNKVIDELKKDTDSVALTVSSDNSKALILYEKAGFTKETILLNEYGNQLVPYGI